MNSTRQQKQPIIDIQIKSFLFEKALVNKFIPKNSLESLLSISINKKSSVF